MWNNLVSGYLIQILLLTLPQIGSKLTVQYVHTASLISAVSKAALPDLFVAPLQKQIHFLNLFVFAVLLVLPGASSPASLPANTRWAALPIQTLPQHRQHHRRRWAALNDHATSVSEPQVHNSIIMLHPNELDYEVVKLLFCPDETLFPFIRDYLGVNDILDSRWQLHVLHCSPSECHASVWPREIHK